MPTGNSNTDFQKYSIVQSGARAKYVKSACIAILVKTCCAKFKVNMMKINKKNMDNQKVPVYLWLFLDILVFVLTFLLKLAKLQYFSLAPFCQI